MKTGLKQSANLLVTSMLSLVKRINKEIPAKDLSPTERLVLRMLNINKQLLASEIAEKGNFSTQLTSQAINKLHQLNFIEKTASEEDKRKVHISLTPEGAERIQLLQESVQAKLIELIQNTLDKDEIAVLHQAAVILDKLAKSNA